MRVYTSILIALQFVCFGAALSSGDQLENNSIDLELVSTWSKSPFKLNLIESFAINNQSTYLPLINKLFGISTHLNEFGEEEIVEEENEELSDKKFYEFAKSLISDPSLQALIDIELINKVNTPRVQANYQTYLSQKDLLISKCDSTEKSSSSSYLIDGTQTFVYCNPSDIFALKTTKFVPYDDLLKPSDRVIGDSLSHPLYFLYGDYKDDSTRIFYKSLLQFAINGKLSFVWRYVPDESISEKEVIGGYGVDLTLKRTDYIAIDDTGFTKDQQEKLNFNKENSIDSIDSLANADNKESKFWDVYRDDISPLPKDEISTLGYKFTKFIQNTKENSFELFKTILFDLPKYARDISLQVTDDQFDGIDSSTQKIVQSGIPNGILVNGNPLDPKKNDIFGLIKNFKKETNFINSIKEINSKISNSNALKFILSFGENIINNLYENKKTTNNRYDVSDHLDSIIFVNDLERNPYYQEFIPAKRFLRNLPTDTLIDKFPEVKENINKAIFIFQFSDGNDMLTFLKTSAAVIQNKIGQQIGVIPLILNEVDRAIAEQFYLAYHQSGHLSALQYLIGIHQDYFANGYPLVKDENQFIQLIKKFENNKPELIENYFTSIDNFMNTFHINNKPTIINNGVFVNFDNNWREAMIYQLRVDFNYLKKEYDSGNISKGVTVKDYLYKNALKQRIPFIIPELSVLDSSYSQNLLSKQDILDFLYNIGNTFTYTTSIDDKEKTLKTITLIGDSSNQIFIDQLKSVFQYAETSTSTKIRVIDFNSNSDLIDHLKNASKSTDEIIEALENFKLSQIEELDEDILFRLNHLFNLRFESSKDFFILLNGRIIDTNQFQSSFTADQYNMLVEYETNLRLDFIYEYINSNEELKTKDDNDEFIDEFDYFEYISIAITRTSLYHESSIFGSTLLKRVPISILEQTKTITKKSSDDDDDDDSFVRIDVIGDPVSEELQKNIGLVTVFEDIPGIDLYIHLTPTVNEGDSLNIKRFYRFISGNKLEFNDKEEEINDKNLKCLFTKVPEKTLFTLDIDSPNSWIVNIKEANTDFDNVKLDLIENGPIAKGVYELKNILIEGHARELENLSKPPVGVSVELLDYLSGETYSDTNVMATMGYLQLKANPGTWNFQIKPNTKSSEIYSLIPIDQNSDIISIQKNHKESDFVKSLELTILDLRGLTIFPVTVHNKGYEGDSLIDIENMNNESEEEKKESGSGSGSGLFNKVLNFGKSKLQTALTKSKKQADINIFSVASGHLYERFLGIMIASVMKHTDKTVKFWLIDNYMSPDFQNKLPILSQKYGFEYELITYKWPNWLINQREKQRTIWGYKILFLDALFPQDLDKVIFVDSDQIIRTDMKELMDLDLQGAPYGYTPMCNSREEMKGFRFWEQGYWKELLGDDYKYHISALYVIDLKKFRSIAAGDLLRQHYQNLSKDPNSLSNLDQDLPNNLQHSLKIFSLPQEWLWCETWCDDESLKTAKTIDLCNNPLTKESKLSRAKRQIPEWTSYDDEITQLFNKTEKKSEINQEHDEL